MRGTSVLVARLLWIFPALLFFLAIYQAVVAYDIRKTLIEGTPTVAEVTEFESTNRVDVTYDYVSLRAVLPDGSVVEKERMSLPHSLINFVRGHQQVDVLVRPGARQEIVIREIGESHWRVAAVNVLISFVGFVFFGWGVLWWNGYLARKGDPARQTLDPDAEPA